MQEANVSVIVNGQTFVGWESVSVRGAVKEAARSFSLTIAAEMGGQAAAALFALFSPVQIFESGEMVFNGYVDKRTAKLTKERGTITVTGRAKGADAIDCSAVHQTGHFDNKTPLDIAKTLDLFNIGFSSDVQLDPVPSYQLKPGASHFREIERLCRDQGATLCGQPDGSIKITKAGQTAKRQSGMLQEGSNWQEIEGDFSGANRHSDIRVRGQSFSGSGKDALQIEGKATDDTVPRYRPLIFVQDANTDKTRAKNRAVNRRDKAAGESIRAGGKTPGWRDEAGALWMPGNIVWCSSEFINLEQNMLIETAVYEAHATGEGSFTHFGLVDPRAHGGKASQAGQSGSQWAFDNSQGSDS